MWIMTTDFSELTPRQTRRVVRFTEPMFLTRSSPRADWRDAKLRGKTLFVVRHFVTLMAGTARACSAVFETCHFDIDYPRGLASLVLTKRNAASGNEIAHNACSVQNLPHMRFKKPEALKVVSGF